MAVVSLAGTTLFLVASFWLLRLDIVVERHATRADAVEARLFERRWLPIIIPQSARRIELENNLDINTSVGRFEFDPAESEVFKASIANGNDGQSKRGTNSRMNELRERGYTSHDYSNGGICWVFLIHSEHGRCEYWAVQTSYPKTKTKG